MNTFKLIRLEDVSGTSGIGVVAQGVVFDNGKVAMTWFGKYQTVTVFDSIEQVKEIHGHEGKTLVKFDTIEIKSGM